MKKQVYYAGCLAAAALLGIGLAACSNEDMPEVAQVEPSTAVNEAKVIIGGFPELSATTRAESVHKTSWEVGDKITLTFTYADNSMNMKEYTASCTGVGDDGSAKWSWGDDEEDVPTLGEQSLIWTAVYTPSTEDNPLEEGTYEYLSATGEYVAEHPQNISIAFERNYSRLHITTGEGTFNVTLTHVVFPNQIPSDGADATPECKTISGLTADTNGDIYLYGQFTDQSRVFIGRATENCPAVSTTCVARTFSNPQANHSYVAKYSELVTDEGYEYAGYCLLNLDLADDNEGKAKEYTLKDEYTKWKVIGSEEIETFSSGWFNHVENGDEDDLDGTNMHKPVVSSGSGVVSVDLSETGIKGMEQTFEECASLITVTLPSALQTLGEKTFYNCSSLAKMDIPASVETLGEKTFYNCSSLVKMDIPASVNFIGLSVFAECKNLKSIRFSADSKLTVIDAHSFENCSSLDNVVLPNSVTNLYGNAFYGCSGLTSITLSNQIERIVRATFYGCSSLTTIELPASVSKLDDYTFYECSNLCNVICNNPTPPKLGIYEFPSKSDTRKLYVPAASVSAYQAESSGWTTYFDVDNIVSIDSKGN